MFFINNIMKKNFIISTIILLIGGLITKILGMLIKIIMTRQIGIENLSLYMLILPTFSLFINLGQIGLPIALSRLVALNNRNNKKLYLSIIPITILINILLTIIIILSANFISTTLLHNSILKLSIIAIALVIPFTTLSGICRSYFFGKEKMTPHMISLITENIIRLILMLTVIRKIINLKSKYIIFYLVISNIISELSSIIILILFIPRNIKIELKDLKPNKKNIYDSYKLGIPNVGSNIIQSISYFLEPIIITNILLKLNYTSTYITHEYGIITGYVIPLLLLPSFFTLAISQALMPYITKEHLNKNNKSIRKTLIIIITIIIIFGHGTTAIFELYGENLLKIIYKTTLGYNYLKLLAPFFIIQYIQSILNFTINALGKVKELFKLSIISSITKLLVIILLPYMYIGIYSYIISIIVNIIITTTYLLRKTIIYLKE